MLKTLKAVYSKTSKVLSDLPQSPVKGAVKLIKLVLPDPLKTVYDFLDNYSSKNKWELTNPSSLQQFAGFARNALRLVRLFDLNPQSITKINTKRKSFRLLNFNDLNWKDFFDLDEETYGISGPVSVTPISSLVDEESIQPDPSIFQATVRFRIFHRQKDNQTIYHVKPNIVNGKIVDARTVLHTSAYSLASKEELAPYDCHQQPHELFKICHKPPQPISDSSTFGPLTKCGAALLSKVYTVDYISCPTSYPNLDPFLYRADCDSDGHSSVVFSATEPLQLAFICDNEPEETRNFLTFPERVKTDCEVRQLAVGYDGAVVPQFSPDFEQDPKIGPTFPYTHPAPPEPFDYILLVVTPVAAGVGFLIVISVQIYCYCKYCKCCKRSEPYSFEIGPHVPSSTFKRPNSRPQSFQEIPMTSYPLLE
jgi:hypothetical protein